MKPLVSMRAALGDDELLGKALPGPSWASWRVLLVAIMGEPLLDEERAIFAELTGGREREPCELVEEFHAVVGRRSGKTRAAATLATYLATLVDHSDRLAPGERAVLPILSATQWQATRCFHLVRGIFDGAPALASLIKSETADTLRLSTSVDLETRPANFRSIRGATAIAFVCDEVGFWYSAEQARNPPPGYTILLSPGICNPVPSAPQTPAIPETSAWIMLLAGFAGLGLLGCRASARHASALSSHKDACRLKSSSCTAASRRLQRVCS
jgi:hypothetical protein